MLNRRQFVQSATLAGAAAALRLGDDMVITENGAELFTPQSPSIDEPFHGLPAG